MAQASGLQKEPRPSWTKLSHPLEQEGPTLELPPAWLWEEKHKHAMSNSQKDQKPTFTKTYGMYVSGIFTSNRKHSTWAEKLTSSCSDSCPQIGRELLWILVLQDEFGDSSLTQRAGSSHGSNPALLLYQLAVDQSYQFPLHGSTQHALGRTAQTHTW